MHAPRAYRKRPVKVQAMRWLGTNTESVITWIRSANPDAGYELSDIDPDSPLLIRTLEGVMRADVGDWIVRGVANEFYPVKPEIFTETYALVETQSPAGRPASFSAEEDALADWFAANGVDEWMPQCFRTWVGPNTLTYESFPWSGPRGYQMENIAVHVVDGEIPTQKRTVPLLTPLTDDIRHLFALIGYALEEVDHDPPQPWWGG